MPNNETANPNFLVNEWIKKAAEDELSSKAILKDKDGAPSSVCFMSQQMAEKYLKAFLISKKKSFPKIHNLERILELCLESDSDFIDLKEEAIELSEFYIESRYPGDYPEEISWQTAEETLAMAERVKKFVSARIPGIAAD